MDTATLLEWGKEAPGLVALILIVIYFLRHTAKGETRNAEMLRDIRGACNDCYERSINKGTTAIEKNTEVQGQVCELLRRLNGKV